MGYRHEWKCQISRSDLPALRRLSAVARADPHGVDGRYMVRSSYLDTPTDRALRDKLDGVSRREKFRIRCYGGDLSLIRLEKKSKLWGLEEKQTAPLTAAEVGALLDGRLDWMPEADRPLVRELYAKMRTQGLAPRTIVDYTREPFIYPPGNVRVTLDYDIRTGLRGVGLLDRDCPTVPVPDDPVILEVKWDAYLPSIVRDAVQLEGRRAGAFSKYAACRTYG